MTIQIVLRTKDEIEELFSSDTFRTIEESKHIQKYVTFLRNQTTNTVQKKLENPLDNFEILSITNGEIISILRKDSISQTPDFMKLLKQQFGKEITTRTWKTLEKVRTI